QQIALNVRILFIQCYADHRDLHSFPTRRSSDLCGARGDECGRAAAAVAPGGGELRRAGQAPVAGAPGGDGVVAGQWSVGSVVGRDRKSTRLNSSHVKISYAVFCLKKKRKHSSRR